MHNMINMNDDDIDSFKNNFFECYVLIRGAFVSIAFCWHAIGLMTLSLF